MGKQQRSDAWELGTDEMGRPCLLTTLNEFFLPKDGKRLLFFIASRIDDNLDSKSENFTMFRFSTGEVKRTYNIQDDYADTLRVASGNLVSETVCLKVGEGEELLPWLEEVTCEPVVSDDYTIFEIKLSIRVMELLAILGNEELAPKFSFSEAIEGLKE